MEPLTLEYVAKIIRYERPDAIVPGLGGQTGLNLAVQLAKKGILKECQVEILGTVVRVASSAPRTASCSRSCARSMGEPVLPSEVAYVDRRGRRDAPRRSAIRWCCVPPSRWAARAAASPTTSRSCAR